MKLQNKQRDALEKTTLSPDAITLTSNIEFAEELKDLKAAHERRPTKVYLVTLAAAALSGFMSARGIIEKTIEAGVIDEVSIGSAIMSGAVCCALLTTATMMTFSIAMESARKQRWKVIALVTTLLVPTIGVSSFYSLLGNAGSASLSYNMQDQAIAHREYYAASILDASEAKSRADALIPLRDDICTRADQERLTGRYSGSKGYGKAVQSMDSVCSQITSIVETLLNTASNTEARGKQATEILNKLASIAKDQSIGNVFERQDVYRETANQLMELIQTFLSENVVERLNVQLANLQASVSSSGVQKNTFGQVQSAIIEDLRVLVDKVAENLEGMTDVSDMPKATPPAPLMDMGEAVFHYSRKNTPQYLMALLLDLMVVFYCAALTLSRSIPQARKEEMLESQPSSQSSITQQS